LGLPFFFFFESPKAYFITRVAEQSRVVAEIQMKSP
jgi:hypothetical protein